MRPNLSNILKVLGIPTGGTAGQVLKKTGSGDTDYGWANESGGGGREVPTGGDAGQVLKKYGSGDTAYDWDNSYEVPTNGSIGQYLKRYGTDPDQYMWDNIPTPTVTLPDLVIRYNITTRPSASGSVISNYVYINGTRGAYTRIDRFLESYYNTHAIIKMDIDINGDTLKNVTPVIYRISTRYFYLTFYYMHPYEENMYIDTYYIEDNGNTKLSSHKKVT